MYVQDAVITVGPAQWFRRRDLVRRAPFVYPWMQGMRTDDTHVQTRPTLDMLDVQGSGANAFHK